MQNGYFKKQEMKDLNTAKIVSAVYNTIPRKKGSQPFEPMDFMPKKISTMSEDDQQERAAKRMKDSERFNKGVVKTDVV